MRRNWVFFVWLAAWPVGAPAQSTGQTPPVSEGQQPKRPSPRSQDSKPKPPDEAKPGEKSEEPDADSKDSKDPDAQSSKDKDKGDAAAEGQDQIGGDSGAASAPDYTGPSILSRGYNMGRPSLPRERFRPYIGVNAVYDSGVGGAFLGPNGKFQSQALEGADFTAGISGRHLRRKDALDLDLRLHYYWYNGNGSIYGGNGGHDDAISVGYTRVITPRFTLSLHEGAGIFSNTYAILDSVANNDISLNTLNQPISPNTESFDDRTYYSSSQVDAIWQKSARLSMNFGGGFFTVKRQSTALANATGFQARNDIAYRITRKTSVGAYYSFSQYRFSHLFGDAYVHTVGATYSWAFTRTYSVRFRFGGSRVETSGLQSVVLDPLTASILGINNGVERFHAISYVPDMAADLSKNFPHYQVGVSWVRGVSPGNGLILTSQHTSESAFLNYNGFRRYVIGFSVGYDSLASVGLKVGNYGSYYGRANVSHSLPYHLSANAGLDYRQLGFDASTYGRNEYRLSVGISYSPAEGPLKFW